MVQPATAAASQRAIILAAYGLLALLIASTLWGAFVLHWPGLFTDMWDEMPFLQRLDQHRSLASDWLGAYAGSHRLLLPRLVFALEHRLFHHTNVFTTAVSLLLQAITTGWLMWLAWCDTRLSPRLRHALLITIAACGFSALQLYNLLYTFLVQWFGVVAFALGSLAVLVHAPRNSSPALFARMALALLLAALAGFCAFPGVVALLTLALVAIALRLPGKASPLLAALALLAVAVHVLSLDSGGISSVDAIVRLAPQQPAVLLLWPHYVLRFLGTPLTLQSETAGMLLGAFMFAYTGWHGLRWLWRGEAGTPLAQFALAGLAWVCITAVATALGRGLIPVTAIAERFHTVHLLAWPLLMLHAASRISHAKHESWLLAVMTLFLLGVLLPNHLRSLQEERELAQKVRMANIAYSLGMRDWHTHALLSVPHRAAKQNPAVEWRDYTRQQGIGVFATREGQWPGSQPALGLASLQDCTGHIEEKPIDGQYSGFSVDAGAVQAIWALGPDGRITGYALPVLDTNPLHPQGHLSGYRENGKATFVAVSHKGYCRIGMAP